MSPPRMGPVRIVPANWVLIGSHSPPSVRHEAGKIAALVSRTVHTEPPTRAGATTGLSPVNTSTTPRQAGLQTSPSVRQFAGNARRRSTPAFT